MSQAGIQPRVRTLHSDRGAPMTSPCTAQLLAQLGITRSLSRPKVRDDHPFSEAQFKTLKYHPGFPGRFPDLPAAIDFGRSFFPWYHTEHHHAGLAMLTPDDVHHGRARQRIEQRRRTLSQAWGRHPERFVQGKPKPRALPETVWIHPPKATPTVGDAQYMTTLAVSTALTGSVGPVVPPKANRITPWEYDRELYKKRNEVERLFRRIKRFRRVFTRFDKLDVVFTFFIHFALIVDALKPL